MTETSKGTLLALLAVFMFATLGVGFKIAVTRMNSFSVVVWIGIWATAALFSFLVREQRFKTVIDEFRLRPFFFPVAGVIGLGVQQILCLMTYEYIPASQAVILHYTYPLIMMLLSWQIFREKSGWWSLCCVLLGFCGVFVLVSAGGGVGDVRFSTGVAAGLGTAFSFALFCVLIKHAGFSVIPGMFLLNLFGLLFLLCLVPFYPMRWSVSGTDMLLLGYLGVFPTAVAFILWNKALRMIPTSHSSNCALLVPILSLLFIAVLLKEHILPMQAVGIAVVLLSVFLNVRLAEHPC